MMRMNRQYRKNRVQASGERRCQSPLFRFSKGGWHLQTCLRVFIFVIYAVVYLFMTSPVFSSGCNTGEIIKKYGESKNSYKYRMRDQLRVEISLLAESCAGELGDKDILDSVKLAYEFGIFEEVQPLAEKLTGIDYRKIENAAVMHASYSGDGDFLLQLMNLQMKLLRAGEGSLKSYRKDTHKGDVLRYLRNVINREQEIALKRRSLGWLLMCYGDVEAAITEYRIVMEDQPNFWLTPAQLGTRYLETGDPDRAKFFSKYSLSRGDGARAYYNLVEIAILHDDIDTAWRYADKLEDVSEEYMNLAYGRLELLEGNYHDARDSFKRFFDTSPVVTRYWNHAPLFAASELLVRLLDEHGDFPGEEHLTDAAAGLEAEEDYRAAADHYYLLTLINPLNADYFRRLGLCNERLGFNYHAVRAYSLHLYLYPESSHAADIKKFLDSRMIDYDMLEE